MKFLQAMRIKQWSKNVLVLVAPFAAGHIFRHGTLSKTLYAVAAFSFAASFNYILNDIRDLEIDRDNPRKSARPIAAGLISKNAAYLLAALNAALAIFFTTLLPYEFAITLGIYVLLTLLYTFGLKREPIIEFLIVSFGFALRAIGGATATHTPSSRWFLVVSTFGPLVIVIIKRISEKKNQSEANARVVLQEYSKEFLQLVLTVSSGITLTAYSLWAFSLNNVHPFAEISVITVTFALLRYIWVVEQSDGEVPEDVIFGDWYFLASLAGTALLLVLTVYAN